jgi:hypothetical protein
VLWHTLTQLKIGEESFLIVFLLGAIAWSSKAMLFLLA